MKNKVDFRTKLTREISRVYWTTGLSEKELYDMILHESVEDLKNFLHLDPDVVEEIRKMTYSSFYSIILKLISKKRKYFKRSKFFQKLITGGES